MNILLIYTGGISKKKNKKLNKFLNKKLTGVVNYYIYLLKQSKSRHIVLAAQIEGISIHFLDHHEKASDENNITEKISLQ